MRQKTPNGVPISCGRRAMVAQSLDGRDVVAISNRIDEALRGRRGHSTRSLFLNIQIAHLQRVLFDELAAGLDLLAHEDGEDLFGGVGVLEGHL